MKSQVFRAPFVSKFDFFTKKISANVKKMLENRLFLIKNEEKNYIFGQELVSKAQILRRTHFSWFHSILGHISQLLKHFSSKNRPKFTSQTAENDQNMDEKCSSGSGKF